MSLLSKIGGDSKGQIMVMPNLNYGSSSGVGMNHGGANGSNILINQSSQGSLPPSHFYDAAANSNVSHSNSFNLHATKSAAGGKRIGLSRASIETVNTAVALN